MSLWSQTPGEGSTRWLSRELAELLADAGKCIDEETLYAAGADGPARRAAACDLADPFDVLIIGSGYGGSVAAAGLAGCVRRQDGRPISVAVLERGLEYLPGSFPSRMADLPRRIRGSAGGFSRGGEGLFDLRLGADVSVIVANGLGGGSLINAGVMAVPDAAVFAHPAWPQALQDPVERERHYRRAMRLLGAQGNHIGGHAEGAPAKTEVLMRLAQESREFQQAALSIAMRDKHTAAGVELKACKRCGDCATGCNYAAKESLDTNLLVQAVAHGARIYCGATVLRLRRAPKGWWAAQVVHTEEKKRLREGAAQWVLARRIVLAAGTLGSTELLLRSQCDCEDLRFSPRLGQGFSTNGDALSFGYDYGDAARSNAVADEDEPPARRNIGPTITGLIRTIAYDDAGAQTGPRPVVIEDLAVPGALGRLTEEMLATAQTLYSLDEFDGSRHADGHPQRDPFAVHRQKIRDTAVIAMMGDDGAQGSMHLAQRDCDDGACDGQLSVVWPQLRDHPLFEAQARLVAARAKAAGYGGRTLPNPLWRLLPPNMGFLLDDAKGPLLTTHPLGGCAMGRDADEGVVDRQGRVFDPDKAGAVHPNLFVLDAAILPCALGINPALTITTLALLAVDELCKEFEGEKIQAAPLPAQARPRVGDVEQQIIDRPKTKTVIGVTERLLGPMQLDIGNGPEACRVALTLTYEPLPIEHLFRPNPDTGDEQLSRAVLRVPDRNLQGNERRPRPHGVLDIYPQQAWDALSESSLSAEHLARKRQALMRRYSVSGSLTIWEREASSAWQRVLGAAWAWLGNRGPRDIVQDAAARRRAKKNGVAANGPGYVERARGLLKTAAHAGERRLFRYDLTIGKQLFGKESRQSKALEGGAIGGYKRITYARPSNPWRQLQELHLSRFGHASIGEAGPVLTLDPQYLAQQRQPLLRIEQQRDHLEALADIASLALYFLRMMLSIHLWNLRKPDLPRVRAIHRLPGPLSGLPPPQVHTVDVDLIRSQAVKLPVQLRLTRYRKNPAALDAGQPVLLIHGYSASGTTFAHPVLQPGLARYLADRGRDVWVADLRSSAGMPFAQYPWTFERVALSDIPAAVDYVWRHSGRRKIDVVAHCMGSVMFSMAVLSAGKSRQQIDEILNARQTTKRDPICDRHRAERRALPGRIRHAVLSQYGPVVAMSPQNLFRAFVMSYLVQAIGPVPFDFRREAGQGLLADLLDRLFASLPYPDDELRRENRGHPCGSIDYVAARHRMDAMYGRTFTLANMSPQVLDHIDDLFGPLNLDTVAQVVHFAERRVITTRGGLNVFVTRKALRDSWTFPTLSVHGDDNGLADVATLGLMSRLMNDAGAAFETRRLAGVGHQDSLIGTRSPATFAAMFEFLENGCEKTASRRADRYQARLPVLGPMLTLRLDDQRQERLYLSMAGPPELGAPLSVFIAPLRSDRGPRWSIDENLLAQIRSVHPDPVVMSRPDGADWQGWFSIAAPSWIDQRQVRHIALFLLYREPALDDDDAPDPGRFEGGTWFIDAPEPDPSSSPDLLQHRAMQQAINRLSNAWTEPDVTEGVVDLRWRHRDPRRTSLELVLGSCQFPPGIVNEYAGYRSWQGLNQRLDAGHDADMLLLAGDQIYADATGGVFDSDISADRYRKSYENWLGNLQVRRAMRRLPLAADIDDHEIDDNWEPIDPDSKAYGKNWKRRDEGIRYFKFFQRADGSGLKSGQTVRLWESFKLGRVPVFMLDSRTQRLRRTTADIGSASMLGKPQWGQWLEFKQWLIEQHQQHPEKPKLVVAPSLLLPRHRNAIRARLAFGGADVDEHAALNSDAWDGFPDTYYRLLALIADLGVQRLIFLSGDEHVGLFSEALVRRDLPESCRQGVKIYSIHTAGLNTPYRFANAAESDFLPDESFEFQRPGAPVTDAGNPAPVGYHVQVSTRMHQGAGFTFVSLHESSAGAWSLRCEYDSEHAGSASVVICEL